MPLGPDAPQSMLRVESDRRPIPNGHFRIPPLHPTHHPPLPLGPEQKAGESKKLGVRFPDQSLAQPRAPPPPPGQPSWSVVGPAARAIPGQDALTLGAGLRVDGDQTVGIGPTGKRCFVLQASELGFRFFLEKEETNRCFVI